MRIKNKHESNVSKKRRYFNLSIASATLIVAWVFELTAEGFRRDDASGLRGAIAPKTSRKFDGFIMLVLALALRLFAFDKFVLDPQRDADLVERTAL